MKGYSARSNQGIEIDNSERNVSAYENAIDTIVGGDNDDTGYYFIFDENNEPQLTSVEDEPITFTLEGSGTEADPYLIHNPKEWNEATTKAQLTGIYFKIVNDIDFSGKEFYKMGSISNTFKGVLDGNNKTLRGIELKGGAYQGVVGYTANTAIIKDLNVENSNVLKATYSGMIVGYNSGTVKHIYEKDINITGTNYIGGTVGYNYGSTSKVQTIEALNIEVEGNDYVGGILGRNEYGLVREIKFDTKVTGNNYVGGVTGYTYSNSVMANGVGKTEVKGNSYTAGGISGSNNISNFIIEDGSSSYYGFTGGSYSETNCFYIDGYSARSNQGTKWPTSYLHDLEQYSTVVETPITGDTDGSGYIFDYILGDGEIHLVPISEYSGWKLMNNKTPMTSQKWSYYDSNHERIQSGWHELYDFYNNLQWFYFENSYAKSGWLELDGKKYYLSTFDPDGNGYMDCNRISDATITIDGESYTFDSDGVCISANCN